MKKKILATVYNGLVEYDLFAESIKVVNDTAMNNGTHGALADVSKLRGFFPSAITVYGGNWVSPSCRLWA